MQLAFPAFSRRNAALRVEIKEISSFQPLSASQSRRATASALLVLEWLKKMRDTITAPKELSPRGKRIDAGGSCHYAVRAGRVSV